MAAWLAVWAHPANGQKPVAQEPPRRPLAVGTISGRVLDASDKPVLGAQVKLEKLDAADSLQMATDASGGFTFSGMAPGHYAVHAEKPGVGSGTAAVVLSEGVLRRTGLALKLLSTQASPAGNASVAQTIEFSDEPNFTVAGVTDWTAVGGHGSDATLRTSEDLTRETLTLKAGDNGQKAVGRLGAEGDATEARLRAALAAAPQSYAANHDLGAYYLHSARYQQAILPLQAALELHRANAEDEYNLALACRGVGDFKQARRHVNSALRQTDGASFHRLAGELDEKLDDPLAAVQQMERAAHLEPSEENYFAWGSELLLHRAVWQAAEVFSNGAKAHPASARMMTAWGTALFAGALYAEAARRLCQASDLSPTETAPYLFMGKAELASPTALPCVEQRLERFLRLQPDNAAANYLFAMALRKEESRPDAQRVESLLRKAVTLDPHYSEAFLQLGIASFARRNYPEAIDFYTKAIEANPQEGEAHYRLGIAYDRVGDGRRAKQELQLHDDLEKAQADTVEQQRRQVKQFLVVLQQQPSPTTHP